MVGASKLTPYLVVDGGNAAVEWYQKALGATVIDVSHVPDTDKIMNAQLMIGDSRLMLNDEFPDYGALGPKKTGSTSVTIHVESDDIDND
jgi:PhnB protein